MTSSADIMKLESAFWQALVDGQPDKAAGMLTGEAVNVAMYGIHHFSPADYVRMAEQGPAKLTAFSFSNQRVMFPAPDVAIASYEVKQAFEMEGEPQEMVCFDTTTWVHRNGQWLAAAHTETPRQDRAQVQAAQ